jgi:DNA polymerase
MANLSPLQRQYLDRMGVTVWVSRAGAGAGSETKSGGVEPEAENEQWLTLGEEVASCTRCELHRGRTNTVFGVGNQKAGWLVIGEAPGAEEDRRGEPFVGRAGQLLNAMLGAMGLAREEVYIANILKCRPPNNRDSSAPEVAACEGYLKRQIDLIRPALILVLGRIAAHNLLKVETPLGRMRGKPWEWNGIPVVVTYHPAYLLRSPAEKRKAWQDLQLALSLYPGKS